MPTSSESKVTRAVRGTPSVFAHVIAFVLGGSLAALVTRRHDEDEFASALVSLPAAKTIEADEPEEPSVAAWKWAAEPAPQPAEFAADGLLKAAQMPLPNTAASDDQNPGFHPRITTALPIERKLVKESQSARLLACRTNS